jgi:hypothetical protein
MSGLADHQLRRRFSGSFTCFSLRSFGSRLLFPVIGAPLQDRLGSVKLLEQQEPGQFMGEGHW